jgi:hypothetical protein
MIPRVPSLRSLLPLTRTSYASATRLFLGSALVAACAGAASDADARPRAARSATVRRVTTREAASELTRAAPPPRNRALAAWIRAHAPLGTDVDLDDGVVTATYLTKKGDTLASIARALLPMTETYLWDDFARELVRANPRLHAGVEEGMRVSVPNLVSEPYALADAARIGTPDDGALRGVYVRGTTAGGRAYVKLLDKMVEHGMNAIVLDTKDTDGLLTYPSKVPLAVETEATKDAPIVDLARTIRFAHARGIRVVMRVSCFHDEWMQHHKGKEMSIRGKWGGIYPLGWLDPANEMAHGYLIDLAKEAMDAGADEIELDYVRYPVIGIHNADFHLDRIGKTKPEVIRDFVREVHAVTQARHVPLSLDIFGVVAQGKRVDIDGLGQDIAMLGPECEVLSPMVYPSHYAVGFMGFEVPGNHPELVGVGTKGTVAQLGGHATRVRPWVQAMAYESPDYGPQYLAKELKSAEENGASGWLMWNPQQEYGTAWAAMPKKAPRPRIEVASR